ncbi:cytochrome c oxidase subunit II [Legionella sp. W05-934-2]|uniref:cytochrome c oxidase subunit II n=1 Tax=Legionella sp. W05-934-2 TaxID=1198649 RepID=UPI0034628E52
MLKRVKLGHTMALLCMMGFMGVASAAADPWQLNMPRGVTPTSEDMFDLHMIAMVICLIIGIVVFGAMIYSIIHHRKSIGHKAASFHDNTRLEIVWTIIPFLILVGLAIPATKVLQRMEDAEESEVTIKITGYQWKWRYEYLNEGINYFSILSTPYDEIEGKKPKNQWYLLQVDKPLVLPINKKVRFLVTSNDVIHSWWVPDLGVKRDAIPGFIHESWARIQEPGVYRGQCTELCGINHAYMPIVVKALPEKEYAEWVKQQTKVTDKYAQDQAQAAPPKDMTFAELMKKGEEKYNLICSACHKPDGKGLPPMFPALQGSSVAIGHPISRHIELILNGVPGSAMQAYKDQLNDEEIAAITTYERNAWGNKTGDLIQPADVAKVRKADVKAPKLVSKAQIGGLG